LENHETITKLQNTLADLDKENNNLKGQITQIEMQNDELQRKERMIDSSFADMEAKYNRLLEKSVLMENDLEEKVQLVEEIQRLKDELRGKTASFI
jgi:nuclear distribution protein NudE